MHLPIVVDMRERIVLLVGGGECALRKYRSLRQHIATIIVVAPAISDALSQALAADNQAIDVTIYQRAVTATDVAAADFAVVAVADVALAAQVAAWGRAHKTLVNTVDDSRHTHWSFPAIVRRLPLMVAISTGGEAPLLAAYVRTLLERLLPQQLATLAKKLGTLRRHAKSYWQGLTGSGRQTLFANFDRFIAGKMTEEALDRAFVANDMSSVATGQVVLVGAGPGDPSLLTLQALEALRVADVVLHDRLIDERVLAYVRRDALCIDVGKRAGQPSCTQNQIHHLLLHHARRGAYVVRLKGGDPFIFGRGGEEVQAMVAAGIPVRVVPGISAVFGCASAALVPLTMRGMSTELTITSLHDFHASRFHPQADIASLPYWWQMVLRRDYDGVTALYMGSGAIHDCVAMLLAGGAPNDRPLAVIVNATLSDERIYFSTIGRALHELPTKIPTPALVIIGEVARLGAEARAMILPAPATILAAA